MCLGTPLNPKRSTLLNIHIIALGSELLRGFVLESNAHWLAQQLSNRDAKIEKVTVLPDDFDRVVEHIAAEIDRCDCLFICGGLGPTDDDLTREAIAAASGLELEFRQDAWRAIQDFFDRKNRPTSPSNRKQAQIPRGAQWVPNALGTAPGIDLKLEKCRLIALPGVPSEFKGMAKSMLLDGLPEKPIGPLFKVWGIGESQLMDLIKDHQAIPADIVWGTIARPEGITVHFDSRIHDHKNGAHVLKACKDLFSPYLYSEKNLSPFEVLFEKSASGGLKIGAAESCTGGMFSEMMTAISGSSSVFSGSVISYSNRIKSKVLGVSQNILDNEGAISEACAIAMAQGAIATLEVDLAVSITGIAGPGGGSAHKPVGTVHIAAAHRDGRTAHRAYRFGGQRDEVRLRSANAAALLALQLT